MFSIRTLSVSDNTMDSSFDIPASDGLSVVFDENSFTRMEEMKAGDVDVDADKVRARKWQLALKTVDTNVAKISAKYVPQRGQKEKCTQVRPLLLYNNTTFDSSSFSRHRSWVHARKCYPCTSCHKILVLLGTVRPIFKAMHENALTLCARCVQNCLVLSKASFNTKKLNT